MKYFQIDFEPVGRRGKCRKGSSLLDYARQLGIELVSLCGSKGTCGRCRIQVIEGSTTELTKAERVIFTEQELEAGFRLACQTYPTTDCKLQIPSESITTPQRTQVEGLVVDIIPLPPVTSYRVTIPAPSFDDYEADAERLLENLKRQYHVPCDSIDISVLHSLSSKVRASKWQVQTSVKDNEVIAVGPWPSRQLGLAVDLGTTKIAGYLLDLESGKVLASNGTMNPQIAYGEDVITRIARIRSSPNEADHLQQLAVKALNELAAELCTEIGAELTKILEAVVVGNTAMHHLLLGLPVEQLALSPYVPAVNSHLDIKARELGIHIAPGGYVHLLPNIAGFVGADHVAMLLAADVSKANGLILALDIGTNTEVCLVNNGVMTSVSCASGPAFEGTHIKHGMRGANGAIEHLHFSNDSIEIQTIGGTHPVGICGSGILDAVAEMYRSGILGANGRMSIQHPRVREQEGQRVFVLVSEEERDGEPAIVITQDDVREVQLAKAAIRTGIQALLENNGQSQDDILHVIIAGAFGTYMDTASAVEIGMLPPLPLNRFRQIGNAAGMGAKLALISLSKRAEAQGIAKKVGYIELAAASNFTRIFAQSNYLGKYRITQLKRDEIEE